jgi:REP element-mobilizing transposase RayT
VASSLSNILIHLVFSTKNRNPLIGPAIRGELHAYLGGILKKRGCSFMTCGGVDDHVHLLFDLPRAISVSKIVEDLKSSSSVWMKTKGISGFYWQTGYGAFSIGRSEKDGAERYVRRQEEHHRKLSFQDEYRQLLTEFGIPFDERYIWD